jgi:hypothetical protein
VERCSLGELGFSASPHNDSPRGSSERIGCLRTETKILARKVPLAPRLAAPCKAHDTLQPSSPRIDEDQISRNLPSKARTVELKTRKRSRRRQKTRDSLRRKSQTSKSRPRDQVSHDHRHCTAIRSLFQPVRSPLSKSHVRPHGSHTLLPFCL